MALPPEHLPNPYPRLGPLELRWRDPDLLHEQATGIMRFLPPQPLTLGPGPFAATNPPVAVIERFCARPRINGVNYFLSADTASQVQAEFERTIVLLSRTPAVKLFAELFREKLPRWELGGLVFETAITVTCRLAIDVGGGTKHTVCVDVNFLDGHGEHEAHAQFRRVWRLIDESIKP